MVAALVVTVVMLCASTYFTAVPSDSEVHSEFGEREVLYRFYMDTAIQHQPWDSKCTEGGWEALTASSGPPLTFCNSEEGPKYSTYYGVSCNRQGGEIVKLDFSHAALWGRYLQSLLS